MAEELAGMERDVKTKWLDRDTVRAPHLALCLSEEAYLAAAKHLKVNHPGEWLKDDFMACVHTFTLDGKVACVVCLRDDREKYDGIDVASALTHEAVHVFQQLCDHIGESSPSREFEAYSIERITEQLLREYARQTTLKAKQ